jgi:heat shock protein HtpX
VLTVFKRLILFTLVNVLHLTNLWIAFLILAGLTGLNAGVETRIWFLYVGVGLFVTLGCVVFSCRLVKWRMGVRVITPATAINDKEKWLLTTVRSLASAAGLKQPPEVGIYQSFEVNTFTTGPSRAKALVAVSQELLDKLPTENTGAILAHEVAHIANGDMVTMTWLQAGLNSMVLAPAYVIAHLVSNSTNPRTRGAVYFLTFVGLQFLLSPLACLLIFYVSRRSELRADSDATTLVGTSNMLAGLKSLMKSYGDVDHTHQSVLTAKISGHSARGFGALFLTHPRLEDRLHRLSDTDQRLASPANL